MNSTQRNPLDYRSDSIKKNKFLWVGLALSLSFSSSIVLAQSLAPMPYSTYGNQQPGYSQPSYQQPNYNQPNYNQPSQNYGQTYQNPTYQGRVSVVPAGTPLNATVSTSLSSELSRVGDRFIATLASPLSGSDGTIAVPAGSQLEGQVNMVKPAGRSGKVGELEIRFNTAVLPNGQRVPLSARIKTDDNTGIIKGGTTAGRVGKAALNTGIGAGLGAALGTAMGPLSGGRVGRGAIYGTAIGGGLGVGSALLSKGKDAVLQTGETLNVTLDQPISITPQSNQSYQNNYNNYNNNNSSGGYYNYGGGDDGGSSFTPYGTPSGQSVPYGQSGY